MSDPLYMPRIIPIRDNDFGFGWLPWAKGKEFELQEDYKFGNYLIPAGYRFDKASIPPLFWGFPFHYTPDGLCTVPALRHDFLCDLLTGGSEWLKDKLKEKYPSVIPTAEQVHHHFYVELLRWGVNPRKARLFYAGVRNFGPGGRLRPSVLWKRLKQKIHITTT